MGTESAASHSFQRTTWEEQLARAVLCIGRNDIAGYLVRADWKNGILRFAEDVNAPTGQLTRLKLQVEGQALELTVTLRPLSERDVAFQLFGVGGVPLKRWEELVRASLKQRKAA